ncbi:carboxypeptidase M-like isoform X1 [Centruroides sculpturatus]|uniref:carboxypeptidase M-like isoform X1 n=1 Tax=Centruroides sculpturatus TaxID=218467 RepID=UPI000C6EF48C|nr:carboxypeptidase M-like isoform X1 [Centruroides sculpturatus]XP_023238321.1 carboxypeptidase M-like isoform X1 [Centruroides sculpturatus]XP_023238322.1 carboxypeptidase M-like isoform X1 [Centruroides sculpturatus]XP_023238323.1 carboxypeptidase M-like isoform X1 [Centruroides sculpturatus]XP_023238324.1 carboxypeptidase M-like isoform X1 [Centruroides sculpturatus]
MKFGFSTLILLLTLKILVYGQLQFTYHNYVKMTSFLQGTVRKYPKIARLYTIGKSVQGRELWVMCLSKYCNVERPLLIPNVKYVANMHGNEAVGREMMLHLIEYLVNNYPNDKYVSALLDNSMIHIMPSMNPDGFELSNEGECSSGQGRYNARGYDLNRNFPDIFKTNNKKMQPETMVVKRWIEENNFVLSGNIHGGALVASYPYDNLPNSIQTKFTFFSHPSPTPDDDVFRHLALIYSLNHKDMHLGIACRDGTPGFPNGTTNGAAWYPLTGGMQDFNYVWGGCMEITLEISCCKYPYRQRLNNYWNANKRALLKFLGEVHRGVKGIIYDIDKNPIPKANLQIKGRSISFHTTKRGEFWRILLPGSYVLEVSREGYRPTEVRFTVNDNSVTIINVTLYEISKAEVMTAHTWHLIFDPSTVTDSSSSSSIDESETVNDINSSGDDYEYDAVDNNTFLDATERLLSSTIEEPIADAVAEDSLPSSSTKLTFWTILLSVLLL